MEPRAWRSLGGRAGVRASQSAVALVMPPRKASTFEGCGPPNAGGSTSTAAALDVSAIACPGVRPTVSRSPVLVSPADVWSEATSIFSVAYVSHNSLYVKQRGWSRRGDDGVPRAHARDAASNRTG